MSVSAASRATVSVDAALYDALRARASESGRSVGDVVDEALRVLLAEDAEDLAALDARRDEPTVPFDDMMDSFRARGLI